MPDEISNRLLLMIGGVQKGMENIEKDIAEIKTGMNKLKDSAVTKSYCSMARAEHQQPQASTKKLQTWIAILGGITVLLVFLGTVFVKVIETGQYIEKINQRIGITQTPSK